MRGGELEIVTRFEPHAGGVYEAFERIVRERHAQTLFSDDGTGVDEQVASMLVAQGLTVAAAESCTGGLMMGRLTDRPGASAYLRGRLRRLRQRSQDRARGRAGASCSSATAPSPRRSRSRSPQGARERAGADIGIGITGVAGPDGGTPEKPVGLVWIALSRRGRPPARAPRRPARQPRRHPRAHDDLGDAPAAAPAARRERPRGRGLAGARDAAVRRRRAPASTSARRSRHGRAARSAGGEDPRRIGPDALHLTLCFLGEQPPSAVGVVASALEACTELLAAVDELSVGPARVAAAATPARARRGDLRPAGGAARAARDAGGDARGRARLGAPARALSAARDGCADAPGKPAGARAPADAGAALRAGRGDAPALDAAPGRRALRPARDASPRPASSVRGVSYGDFPERP